MKIAIIIASIFFALTNIATGEVRDDNGGVTLADLPSDVLQELMILVKGQKLTETLNCVDIKRSEIDLLLYTRNNRFDPYVLDASQPGPVTPNKKLILIIHGWIQKENGYGMQELKNAYLDRYDANVVIVSWKNLAWDLYTRAVCKLPKIAKIVAKFLCTTSQQTGVDLEDVRLVGHSLGGQMSGFIGQYTQTICGQKIGRITGLDPAGPLYTDAPKDRRLDAGDAKFVDVIHTNGGVFGYFEKCGHADFFVNCGVLQPGCIIPDIDISGLMNLPLMAVGCPHFRAMDIMAEAVRTNDFKAIPCQYCPIGCPPVMSVFKKKTIMGEQCPTDARGGFYVLTNMKSPYPIVLQANLN